MAQSPQLFLSTLRIILSYGPGLAMLLIVNGAIWLQRPDIVDRDNRVPNIPTSTIYQTYDFVVVGGGSAGAAVTARLSEIYEWNILLLEAGGDETFISEVPQLFPSLQMSVLDWRFKTEYSGNYCLALENGRCHWPRGKVLGGSSVLNAMLYIRGNQKDYNQWEQLGNPGWGWSSVLPYFKKLEDMRTPEFQNEYHGIGGPISAEHYRTVSPLTDIFLEAAKELNLINPYGEMNGPSQTGFARAHGSIRDGLRCSSAKGYLRKAHHRPNLHIALHSHVTKIIINPETKQAYGVTFIREGQEHIVYASREIILSSGAIQTPQLLKLSGVGPADELNYHNIPVIQDLPGVGENLQDHVAMGGGNYLITNPVNDSPLSFIIPRILTINAARLFIFNHTGPLYGMPFCEVMGYINTKYQDPKEDWPDIQLFMASLSDTSDGGLFGKRVAGMTDEYYEAVYESTIYKDAYTVVPLLMRPKSRGRILLRNANPLKHPKIYPNYFEDPQDLKVLIEGAKFGYQFAQTKVMRALNATLNPHNIQACAVLEHLSDEYWSCIARYYSQTIYHPVGTAKMGPADDLMAVVDHTLKVHGILNLRVIDASIMPTIVNGNTNIPSIMIGEKGADMIKDEHLNSKWDYYN